MQHDILAVMASLHWGRRTRIQIPDPIATLYFAEHVHITQTRIQITTTYFYGQEFKSVSVSESVSGNVNEPLRDYADFIIFIQVIHVNVNDGCSIR